ncbi:Gfo/Idh/MocA family protein, partial [Chloroflexota bacterium]
MKRLKAGIIGLGVGEKHAAGYHNHSGCEVAALCDFSEEKLEAVRDKYPDARLTTQADEVLSDPEINIVSIASYDNYHHEQIVKAINNDKHIFVEKPLCLYEVEAVEIKQLLQEKPHLKLSSNLILRMSPRFRMLKQMIADGELGQLFYVEGDYNYGRLHKITEGWRGKIDFYSVVYGGGVHVIDLLLWLTGDRVIEVAAYGNNLASSGTSFRYNDMVVSILKFESGM